MDDVDEIERMLAESNKGNVALIGDGLTKQHFIELDYESEDRGPLFEYHVNNNSWLTPFSMIESGPESSLIRKRSSIMVDSTGQLIFQTEVDDEILKAASKRLAAAPAYNSYFFEKGDQIRQNLIKKASDYHDRALTEYESKNYELAIERLNKAFCLQPTNLNFYLLKLDCFIQLVDFKSALLTINKVLSMVAVVEDTHGNDVDELRLNMAEKTVFCHYMMGQTFYDAKLYYEALEAFNKASELRPLNLPFKMRR
jgi:tetratricopeptide (TPR) repeat protein